MWWKALGVFLVLLVVGAASGYALGDYRTEGPDSIPSAEPLPAVSPSYPVPPTVTVLPDPDDAPLLPDVPSAPRQLVGAKHGFPLTADIPVGWTENRAGNRFTWVQPGTSLYTYLLRADVLADQHEATDVAVANRIAQLRSAVTNQDLSDLTVETRTDDYLVVSYVDDHDYLRWAYQQWVTLGGTTTYADVAATGRLVDRAGLSDLVQRVAASMVAQPLAQPLTPTPTS